MGNSNKWLITEEEKDSFIKSLTDELPALRAKAGVPQDELAKLVGISRQTYGAIERKSRKMLWGTYLSLILFFDYNKETHDMLRHISAFPTKLVERFNDGWIRDDFDIEKITGLNWEGIKDKLDDQAIHSIKTLIMLEYARCNNLSGDAVVKSFDGRIFNKCITEKEIIIKKSLKSIKEQDNNIL